MIIFSETRPATLRDVSRLRSALARRLGELRLPEDLAWEILLAVAEAGANIILHSRTPAKDITLRVDLRESSLRVKLTDDGSSFANCLALYEAAGRLLEDPLAEGRRGLRLIATAFERLEYTSGARNSLVGWRSLRPLDPLVLIVEDDPALLDLYCAFLRHSYRTMSARSIEEAIGIVRTRNVDVIVSDLHLDDGLGTSFLHNLDLDETRLAPPIIVMTSDTDADLRQSTLVIGAEFFLRKPVTGARLREALEITLARTIGRAARLARHFVAQVNGFVTCVLPTNIYGLDLAQCGCGASAGGGDLVIHHPFVDRNRIIMVDVMGHGVSAKAWSIAYAGIARTLLHSMPQSDCSNFLSAVAAVAWSDPAMEAVIATALVMDIFPGGKIEIASAGHPLPMIVDGACARQVEVSGALLGVLGPSGYTSVSLDLACGERLVLSTDGVDIRDASAGGELPGWLIEECCAPSLFETRGAALRRRADDLLGIQPVDDWTVVVIGRPVARA